MVRIYLIDGIHVPIEKSELKSFCLVTQDVYFKDGDKMFIFPLQLYSDKEGKLCDPEDAAKDLSGHQFFNEKGGPLEIDMVHFSLDCILGFIYNNRIYICDLLNEG